MYWEHDPTLATIPIAFFHVTNYTLSVSADVAQQRVIVFEDTVDTKETPVSSKNNPVYKSHVQAMSDNVVVKPVEYRIEAIVPASPFGPYMRQGINRYAALASYMNMMDGGEAGDNSALNTIMGVVGKIDQVVKIAEVASDALGLFVSNNEFATVNHNSLLAMMKSGHILTMKKWTGYNYAYGVLTNFESTKKGNEDDVFRCNISMAEANILNTSNVGSKASTAFSAVRAVSDVLSDVVVLAQMAMASPWIALSGVMTSSEADTPVNWSGALTGGRL
jgi:hypothetical protein